MDELLSNLGTGALLSWAALPLFAWLVRARTRPDARTLHRAQIATLLAAAALFLLPWLPFELPRWLASDGPYYSFQLSAVLVPMTPPSPFEPHSLPTALSPISLVGAAWLILVAVAALRTAAGARALKRLVREADPAPTELVEECRTRAIAKNIPAPELLVSERTAIPFAAGLLRPRIVLPRELVESLDPAALALILEHELEHVQRGDVRFAALITALKLAFAGHPTAAKVAREALLAREIAVDATVSQPDARAYATLLVEIAAHAHFGEKPAPIAIDDTALARRVALITEPLPTAPLSLLPLVAATVAILLAAAVARTFVVWSEPKPNFVRGPGPGRAAGVMIMGGLPRHPGRPMRLMAAPPPGERLPDLIERSSAVHACYAEAAAGDPSFSVHVSFAIHVDAAGVASVTTIVPKSPKLAACLERAVRGILPVPEAPPGASLMVGLELTPESMR